MRRPCGVASSVTGGAALVSSTVSCSVSSNTWAPCPATLERGAAPCHGARYAAPRWSVRAWSPWSRTGPNGMSRAPSTGGSCTHRRRSRSSEWTRASACWSAWKTSVWKQKLIPRIKLASVRATGKPIDLNFRVLGNLGGDIAFPH